jgi:hypothetical protein
MFNKICVILALCFSCLSVFAYRIEGGEYYVGAGFGAHINVLRYEVEPGATPKADLPLLVNIDYSIDQNIGVFGSFVPHFAAGSIAFAFRAGAKYWFTFFEAPYVPYISLAFSPAFLFPLNSAHPHFNLGLSPGLGIDFFVMANFLVGAHAHFNPSIAFINNDKKGEFAVTALFDVAFRI